MSHRSRLQDAVSWTSLLGGGDEYPWRHHSPETPALKLTHAITNFSEHKLMGSFMELVHSEVSLPGFGFTAPLLYGSRANLALILCNH